jgi:hypothetical protein
LIIDAGKEQRVPSGSVMSTEDSAFRSDFPPPRRSAFTAARQLLLTRFICTGSLIKVRSTADSREIPSSKSARTFPSVLVSIHQMQKNIAIIFNSIEWQSMRKAFTTMIVDRSTFLARISLEIHC